MKRINVLFAAFALLAATPVGIAQESSADSRRVNQVLEWNQMDASYAASLATLSERCETGGQSGRQRRSCETRTPSHPEYPAGHPSLNGAAATVLLGHFGRRQTFTLTTPLQPDRTYTSIAQARADGNNARVWGGMHYPSTVAISDAVGEAIAEHVNQHAMQRLHGWTK